jgi:hypothetical protein
MSNTNLTKNKQWYTKPYIEKFLHITICFCEVCVAQSLLFCVVFCISLFGFSDVCVNQSLLFCVGFYKKSKYWATQTSLKANNDLQNTTQKSKDWATQTSLRTNNDIQNTTQKSEDWAIQTALKTKNTICF